MKPQDALLELLNRLAASPGTSTVLNTDELAEWPAAAVEAMKGQKLLTRTRPASSAVCPGCEEECVMPVHVIPKTSGHPALFIACDKRDDVGRVSLPATQLEQWQVTGDSIARLLADLLDLQRPDKGRNSANCWEIRMIEGNRDSGLLTLVIDHAITLTLADHAIPLSQVLSLTAESLQADKNVLLRVLDGDDREPSTGTGSPNWRQQQAKTAANARHDQPGGSRDKQKQIRAIWATGKYSSRERCAEEECAGLNMSFSAARRALRNTPNPTPPA